MILCNMLSLYILWEICKEGADVLGIDDPWIWGVYILCILSTVLCVSYGIANWNKGEELEKQEIMEEAAWEAQELEMQEKELGM